MSTKVKVDERHDKVDDITQVRVNELVNLLGDLVDASRVRVVQRRELLDERLNRRLRERGACAMP